MASTGCCRWRLEKRKGNSSWESKHGLSNVSYQYSHYHHDTVNSLRRQERLFGIDLTVLVPASLFPEGYQLIPTSSLVANIRTQSLYHEKPGSEGEVPSGILTAYQVNVLSTVYTYIIHQRSLGRWQRICFRRKR